MNEIIVKRKYVKKIIIITTIFLIVGIGIVALYYVHKINILFLALSLMFSN